MFSFLFSFWLVLCTAPKSTFHRAGSLFRAAKRQCGRETSAREPARRSNAAPRGTASLLCGGFGRGGGGSEQPVSRGRSFRPPPAHCAEACTLRVHASACSGWTFETRRAASRRCLLWSGHSQPNSIIMYIPILPHFSNNRKSYFISQFAAMC